MGVCEARCIVFKRFCLYNMTKGLIESKLADLVCGRSKCGKEMEFDYVERCTFLEPNGNRKCECPLKVKFVLLTLILEFEYNFPMPLLYYDTWTSI